MSQPDIHDSNPYSTQSYNRYSYAMNNPLKYVDPSGYTSRMAAHNNWMRGLEMRAHRKFMGFNAQAERERSICFMNFHRWATKTQARFTFISVLGVLKAEKTQFAKEQDLLETRKKEAAKMPNGAGDGDPVNKKMSRWVFGQSIDFTLATLGGGYAYEFGFLMGGLVNKGSQFVTKGSAFGFEASAGYNFLFIKTNDNFKFGDLGGMGASWTGNLFVFSLTFYGNSSPGYPTNSVFDTYRGFKFGIGAGMGGSTSPNSTTTLIN